MPRSVEDKATEALNRLKTAKQVVYDSETSGLDWRHMHIVGHVLTFGPAPQDSYYIPVRHKGDKNLGGVRGPDTPTGWDGKLHKVEPAILKGLDRPDLTVGGHNLAFDLKFLSRIGFTLQPRFEDTIINAPLLNEWQGKFSLEACAQKAGVAAKKSEAIVAHICRLFPDAAKDPRSAMGHFWRLSGDDQMAVEYAEGDGTTTWQLRDWQMEQIKQQELERVWDVESRLIPILARMTIRGIKIDEEAFTALRVRLKREIEELLNSFPSGFNPKSSIDVRHWMEKHGCTDWPKTPPSIRFPEGQPSFPQDWLETHEPGKAIVKVRKLITLRDTFVLPLQTTHMWKGRVHTNFNQLRNDEYGTVTGRLSSDSPNMQAVPKHDEETGRMFRTIFVPDEGMTWGSADFSQMEPRLLAYYSRCKVLMEGYRADPPLDAHTAVAIAANRDWHNLTPSEQKFYRNQYAKRINQTIITGGGKGVLVSKYKIPKDEVDKVWADYFRAMPEVKRIQVKMSRVMENRGYILTLLGRRCRLLDRDRSYVALNRALQGGNADALKLKMVEMGEYLRDEGHPIDLLLNCHDAMDFQFSEEARHHYQKCLDIMQAFGPDDQISLDVPITVDVGEGPNWAIATYGPEKAPPTAAPVKAAATKAKPEVRKGAAKQRRAKK